jgi:hypothetical protein
VGDQLPACQMILDIIGDLITHGRQLKHLVFNDRIVSLLVLNRPATPSPFPDVVLFSPSTRWSVILARFGGREPS